MAVRIRKQYCDNGKCPPCVLHGPRPEAQSYDTWQCPNTLEHGGQGALVEPDAESGKGQQENDVAYVVGDCEEVCYELVPCVSFNFEEDRRKRTVLNPRSFRVRVMYDFTSTIGV